MHRQAGYEQSKATAEKVASLIGAKAEDVAVCSTGLIGELLPLDNVLSGADKAFETLADTAEAGADASHAIMTTDTKPKTVELEGPTASVSVAWSRFRHDRPAAGHHAVRHHHRCRRDRRTASSRLERRSRNVVQPHRRGRLHVHQRHRAAAGFRRVRHRTGTGRVQRARGQATASLARQIIGDGEGASHDIRVKVTGATTEEAALACGRAVAASNLLKCAISGNDPNWGRIVSSLGTVPSDVAPYDSEKVTVDVNGVRICENGGAGRDRSEVDMTPREVHIDIDLNAGEAEATVWTDDLTHEYVHINADYES